MPDIFALICDYIVFFPLVAFVCLLLAGFNLPISEDLIIITGALLSQKEPEILIYNLLAIYAGVFLSDFFVFWVGTRVRKGVSKSKYIAKLIPEKALDKMHCYLDKYGIFTFIVCRFIPFGARNTLFFASGVFNLRPRLFVLYDVVAAMISVNTLFFIAYHFGDDVKKPVKIAGLILFVLLVSAIVTVLIRFAIKWRKSKAAASSDKTTETDRVG